MSHPNSWLLQANCHQFIIFYCSFELHLLGFLRFLFSDSSNEVASGEHLLPQADMTLLLKYYRRSRETFGKEAQMDSAMEQHWGVQLPANLSTSMNLCRREYVRFQGHTYLRSLAEAGHKWRNLAVGEEGKNSLSALLLHCKELKGASGREITLRDSTVLTNLCIQFSILQGTKISFYLLSFITKRHSLRYAFWPFIVVKLFREIF